MTELEEDFLKEVYDVNIEKTKKCIGKGVNINLQTKVGEHTALMILAIWGCDGNSIELVKLLLNTGADISIKSWCGFTALRTAEGQLKFAQNEQEKIKKLEIIDLLKTFEKPIQEFDNCRFLA